MQSCSMGPAQWALGPRHGAAESELSAPEYERVPNVILDNPIQAMLLAMSVAASLGLLARRIPPTPQRALTGWDPPPLTRT